MAAVAEKIKVPELRFPGYEGDWTRVRLTQYFNVSRGRFSPRPRNNPIYYGGQFPFVQTSDVVNSNGRIRTASQSLNKSGLGVSKLFESGTVLMTIAANIGYVGELEIPMACPDSLAGLETPTTGSSRFSMFCLARLQRKLEYIAPEAAQKNLNLSELNLVFLNVPGLEEQQKIAEFLTAVDERIAKLKRKKELLEEYKKGMMQKLFSQEIRFKDEDGNDFPEWEVNRMEELFDRVKRKNSVGDDNVLTISGQHGLVSQVEYFNKSVASKDTSGYTRLLRGEFAYNKSYSKGYPFGAIKNLDRYSSGVVSPLYICFKLKGRGSIGYFKHLFEAGYANRGIQRIAQEGARNHGLLNVSVIEFFHDIQLPVPSLEEQHKITAVLTDLEGRVHNALDQIEKAREFKRGLLQKMFV